MRHATGIRVLTWEAKAAIRRAGQVLPKFGERRYIVARWHRWYVAHWVARAGYRITQVGPVGLPPEAVIQTDCHPLKGRRMKRRTAPESGLPMVPLPSESKVLGKLPLLREFVSSTAYDDQSPRTPGYFTLRNRGGSYQITLYDVDAGLRCACGAPTLDDTFGAAELLLGAENAPWEIDQYLTDQLLKKKKKKAS